MVESGDMYFMNWILWNQVTRIAQPINFNHEKESWLSENRNTKSQAALIFRYLHNNFCVKPSQKIFTP